MTQSALKALVFFVLTFVGCLFAFEGVLSFFIGNLKNDTDRLSKVHSLRQQGKTSFLPVSTRDLLQIGTSGVVSSKIHSGGKELVPLSGVAYSTTPLWWGFRDRTQFQWVNIETDESGFYNPSGIWATPVKYGFLGDGYALGLASTPGMSFVDRFRKIHPETLNLAAEKNGPLVQLGQLKEFLLLKRPKLVFWIFSEETSLDYLLDENRNPTLRAYLRPGFSQELWGRREQVNGSLRSYLEQEERKLIPSLAKTTPLEWVTFPRLRHLVKQASIASPWNSGNETPAQSAVLSEDLLSKSLPVFEEVLREAVRVTNSFNGKLVLIYIPSEKRYLGKNQYSNIDRDLILQKIQSAGAEIIDLHPRFASDPRPEIYYPSSQLIRENHWNDLGHAVVTTAILEYLRK